MKTAVALPLLLCLISCGIQPSITTTGGSLQFLSLLNSSTLAPGGVYSERISTKGDFKFGDQTVSHVYVSRSGYISIGNKTVLGSADVKIPRDTGVVSPYGAATDNIFTKAGTIRHTQFSTADHQLSTVSLFIRSKTGITFSGTKMMIAEWDSVLKFYERPSSTSTFQAVLITDNISSYAVFIYECGRVKYGGATIGWAASSTMYETHPLSGDFFSKNVGCEFSSSYSAIIYKINSCDDDQFTCDNRQCVPELFVCDGTEGCVDGSDEQQECDTGTGGKGGTNVGLAVGLPVGLAVLFFAVLILIAAVIVWWCIKHNKRQPTLSDPTVVTTTPASGRTTSTQETTFAANTGGSSSTYETQPAPSAPPQSMSDTPNPTQSTPMAYSTPRPYPTQATPNVHSAQPIPYPVHRVIYPVQQVPTESYPPSTTVNPAHTKETPAFSDAPPPSYDAAISGYQPYAPQGHPQFQSNPIAGYPSQQQAPPHSQDQKI